MFAINKTIYTFVPMKNEQSTDGLNISKRGRPHGTKKEPTKIYARRIKQSKFDEIAPQLDQIINQSNK